MRGKRLAVFAHVDQTASNDSVAMRFMRLHAVQIAAEQLDRNWSEHDARRIVHIASMITPFLQHDDWAPIIDEDAPMVRKECLNIARGARRWRSTQNVGEALRQAEILTDFVLDGVCVAVLPDDEFAI